MQKNPEMCVIILAAGKGSRMVSALPKVLHPLAGLPMIRHVIRAAEDLAPGAIIPVIAPDGDAVRQACAPHPCALQPAQKGTGDAVACALPLVPKTAQTILVCAGDTPLITAETLRHLLKTHQTNKACATLLTMDVPDPTGYGRIVQKADGSFEKIVEEKDADAKTRAITCVNTGVMAFDRDALEKTLPRLSSQNRQNELYLTDVPVLLAQSGAGICLETTSSLEGQGVNDRAQLAQAEKAIQHRLRQAALKKGVTLIDPETVFFAADTDVAADVIIEPHVFFGPLVKIGTGARIRAFSHIEGATVDAHASIGPFARLRPGTHIGAHAKVGNFVEIKNSTLGEKSKANHLAYIGDAHLGGHVNFSAGAITCNYDGFEKYKTSIGDGALIGVNATLIAPVHVGENAYVAAGSTITENVSAEALAIARTHQVEKPGWSQSFRTKKKKA